MQKTLVTGGFGFIGRGLCRALIERGDHVRVLDNASRGSRDLLRNLSSELELFDGDVRDPDLVARSVAGCDRVYHLAAINGTKNFYERPREVLEVGIVGTLNVINAAIAAQVPEFLFMSSSEAYQSAPEIPTDETVRLVVPDVLNPRYSYGGSKIAGELITVNYGREAFDRAVIVRPHNVYGPDMGYDHVIPELALRILHLAAKSNGGTVDVPIQGAGTATRSFVHIDDFIDGTMIAADRGEHLNIYHVGTLDELPIIELARKIAAALGVDARFVTSEEPSGQTQRRCPSIAKVSKLGYAPSISLDAGLPRALASARRDFERQSAA